ncbi:MAG TPA: cytochrome c [Hyphomicrobiaceae bacterium]|jgi:mono/diheme cytochrome c family protein|nr:cytochrome c [Hyphomicrobiaceae bacterium]
MWPNLAVAVLTVVLSSVAAAPAVAQSALIKRGQTIAERLCARCHAIGPVGESPMNLAPPFRSLPLRYPVDHLAEALAEGIVTGHPAMPEFKFSPDEIDELLTFIDSLAPRSERDGTRK